jgi:hypothetical protein
MTAESEICPTCGIERRWLEAAGSEALEIIDGCKDAFHDGRPQRLQRAREREEARSAT